MQSHVENVMGTLPANRYLYALRACLSCSSSIVSLTSACHTHTHTHNTWLNCLLDYRLKDKQLEKVNKPKIRYTPHASASRPKNTNEDDAHCPNEEQKSRNTSNEQRKLQKRRKKQNLHINFVILVNSCYAGVCEVCVSLCVCVFSVELLVCLWLKISCNGGFAFMRKNS